MNNIVTTDTNTNVVVVTAPGPSGPIGPQGPTGSAGTIQTNSGTIVSPFLNVNGSTIITGSLIVSGSNTFINIGPAQFTGSVGVSGSLFATLFSGSGAGLTGIPASGISGLNLNRIASGSISASVSPIGKAFDLIKNSNSIFNVDQFGNISGSGLYISGSSIYIDGPTIRLYGNATLNDAAITTTATTTTDRIQSGTITASVATLGNAFTLQAGGDTIFEVGIDGVLSGSGANLFNIPASGITGLNLSRTATGSVSASVNTTSDTFVLTSASIDLFKISNTGILSGSGANLFNIPASGITGLNLSRIATGSVTSSVNVGTTNFEITSGSTSLMSLDYTGKLIVSKSINAGVPTSNAWQSGLNGSYFNNFTSTSDVSEILRFIAGLLSQSAPDASPNTKTFASTSQTYANNGTAAIVGGYVPQSSTNTDILYLISKDFTQAGSTLFPGKTLYSNSSYSINYTSIAGGSTIVSSSADAQLFGLGTLTSGGPTQFNVSGTINWFYSDNNSETSTATSQSQNLLSNSSFGTTNGLTLAKINTANPAVIPAAYQDGKFATIFSNGLYNGVRSFASVSSSGWYHISSSIAISSGSSAYSTRATTADRIFFAPVTTINTNIGNNNPAIGYFGTSILTATSRSLSGAPYLLTSTFSTSASVTGLFNPLYASSTTIADISESDPLVTVAGTSSASTSGGTVQTTTAVYDSTGVTARTIGTIPTRTDIVRLTGSITFDAGNAGLTNISSTGLGTTTFNLLTRGVNNAGSQGTVNTQIIPYHSASTFGQPLLSGSMAYYGRTSQTYDGGSLTGTSEAFTGEAYRIQLTDAVTTFTGLAWNNAYGLYNLGNKDLQVKPSNLVKPGGTYKYWLNDPSPSDTFKYYVRRFQKSSVLTSFTLNVGKTLVPWDDTSSNNAVAVGIIFESAKGGASNCRLFDPVYANGARGPVFSGATVGTNPFTSALDYYGAGGAVSGTTYTITVQSATNMVLNGTAGSDEIYVIIRYKGDPSPVTSLAVSGT
jgi:trimeric autotransporter adhesin